MTPSLGVVLLSVTLFLAQSQSTVSCPCSSGQTVKASFNSPSVTRVFVGTVQFSYPSPGGHNYVIEVGDIFKGAPTVLFVAAFFQASSCGGTLQNGVSYLFHLGSSNTVSKCMLVRKWQDVSQIDKIFLHCKQSCKATSTVRDGAYYKSLSDDALFNAALSPNRVGTCYIGQSRPGSSAFCDLYVKGGGTSSTGHNGWPRHTNNRLGTGCVRAPDFPKRIGICFYTDTRYGLSAATIASFCTAFGRKNAAAMIRYAIDTNACGLPAGCGSTC